MAEKKKAAKKKVEKENVDYHLYTNSGHKLTPKERDFIDMFLETGHIRDSYEKVYMPKFREELAKDKSLTSKERSKKIDIKMIEAYRILKKDYIAEEIRYQRELRTIESIASSIEILEYFTKVMRGEEKDQFGLDTPIAERTKAAQELAKRTIDIDNRVNGKPETQVHVVLDWNREDK